MKRKRRTCIELHIIVPLLVGAFIYIFCSPEVYFVKCIPQNLTGEGLLKTLPEQYPHFRVIRNYLPDMLWGYALVFALFRIVGNNAADTKKVMLISFLFSAFMELLQLSSSVKGTFDVFDIGAMLVAEVFAVFIINNYYLGGI